jgi:hypothetical protein
MKLTLVITFLISFQILSQDYSRYVIVQKDGVRIEGTNGFVTDTLFSGTDENEKNFSTSINDIRKFYIAGSSKTFTMGALGFLAGLALGLSFDYNYSTSSFRGNPAIIGSCSALGLIVGGIIGSNKYYWKNIDPNTIKQNPQVQEISSIKLQFSFNL